ncbi:hypothetical protein MLD38_032055 [Melastoma candidum]|uniref:Uncharacterized protein n=1 Tax=Melastoma candidum TaxID=119954 RepID=A0ACB9M4F5_9MYRT|nr:hypothetical protein MLD38_032055 [Melastoma candidum]
MESTLGGTSVSLCSFSLPSPAPPHLPLLRNRRQFLGNPRSLRPPGLITSSRRPRLGLRFHPSSSFLVRASSDSHAFVVVVAASVTVTVAVAAVFFGHFFNKSDGQLATRSLDSYLVVFNKYIFGLLLGKAPSAKKNVKNVEDVPFASSKPVRDIILNQEPTQRIAFQESGPASEGILIDDLNSFASTQMVAFSDDHSKPSLQNSFKDYSLSANKVGLLEPLASTAEKVEKVDGAHLQKDYLVRLPELVDQTTLTGHNQPLEGEAGGRTEANGTGGAIGCDSIFSGPLRTELHTFYESKQLATSRGIFPNGEESFMLANHTVSTETAPSLRKKRTGSGWQGSRRNIARNTNGHILELPKSFELRGLSGEKDRQTSELLQIYHQLLRKRRISDCVKLLEDMETRGLLDMEKIYHARFYNLCKSQKAVDEAFRFTRLIATPTLSTFNMLMSVCSYSLDFDGAFQVLQLVQAAGLKPDLKLYTNLISSCAKCGKVDQMFEVFNEMVNIGVEPNVHTYGAIIDGCARAGQVAKAFGAYGFMRSKKVKPDRVVFNALITACGQSGAVDRAFDVLAEMMAEIPPVDPDHITVGALMKACSKAGQVGRAREVYDMIDKYHIKGTPEVYTIAVNCCSHTGDWEFALKVYNDMRDKGVIPDEIFVSALIDVAGHAKKMNAAFEILEEARAQKMPLSIISYSSLMGACSNAKNWKKALDLYEEMKSVNLKPTISTMNALITALCEGDQLPKALEMLDEMKRLQLCPDTITYSILLVASEKKDDIEVGKALFSQAKENGIVPNITMCRCLLAMCARRYEKEYILGKSVLCLDSGRPQVKNEWSSLALAMYRDIIAADVTPSIELVSKVLGCLQIPFDVPSKERITENLAISADAPKHANLFALVEGFGEYDPRAFSLLEEAASMGVVPCVSLKKSPIIIDVRTMHIHAAKVYILTVLKGLKYRLAAGSKLPGMTILLPTESTQVASPHGDKTVNIAGRMSQAVAALLRRLRIPYQGNESHGKVRIHGIALRRWFQPKLASSTASSLRPGQLGSPSLLGRGIRSQQRDIRTGNLSLE